jgi:hypothetical protein
LQDFVEGDEDDEDEGAYEDEDEEEWTDEEEVEEVEEEDVMSGGDGEGGVTEGKEGEFTYGEMDMPYFIAILDELAPESGGRLSSP